MSYQHTGQHTGDRTNEPIAITGIGLAMPAEIGSHRALWRFLCEGVDGLAATWPVSKFPAADPIKFKLSAKEAALLDPQQLLLLHAADRALEDMGSRPHSDALTGVFVGLMNSDHEVNLAATEVVSPYALTGAGRYAACGRLSYTFDLCGPSVTVDTACSASLVACHVACQSLRLGECDMALTGGANAITSSHITNSLTAGGLLSDRSRFGSQRAAGFARGQGAGVLVLQRLGDALRAGAQIYAVILGSAVNANGATSGSLVRPSVSSQVELLHRAYQAAGVERGGVAYVECHGTGTPVGDAIEIEALGSALGRGTGRPAVLRIGSIKSNLGHLEAAAGVAGLAKAALALHHRCLPPTLHCDPLRTDIPWEELKVSMQRELAPLPSDQPSVVGVSSFGLAGTNAHVVLQSPPAAA